MISQIHPINDVSNNQINNDDELQQLNIEQPQQVVPQIEQTQIIQQMEPDQIIQNQDQEPQLQAQLQNYLSEQRASLKLFLKLLVLQFVYYTIELVIFSSCYSISNGQLNMLKSMFIIIIVLDIVTAIEKIVIFENALRYFNYANEGLLPFPIGTSQKIEDIEQEIKLRNQLLLLYSQIRKLFEFGQYIYLSATFYQNKEIQENKFIQVCLIIYLIIRGFILILDLLDLIKSGEKLFQGEQVVNTNLQSELISNIITSLIYLAEIVYLIVIIIKNQTQCQGFNNFFYISLSVNSLIIINKILKAVIIIRQIEQNVQVPYNLGIYQLALFLRTKETNLNQIANFLIQLLYIFNFIFCCISVSQNIDSQCILGDSDFNLQWSFALYFLIVRTLVLGIPTIFIIFSFVLLLLLQVAQNYAFQQSKNFQHQVILIATIFFKQNKIFQLKQETVAGKLSEENMCIICLQEFVTGEQFIRLNCNVDHIYHKACIFDWLIKHPDCPKCRQQI